MTAPRRRLSPTQELTARVLRIVRLCPEAAGEVLELMFLVGQIEALVTVDRDYRDARRVVSRLRDPAWELAPAERRLLLQAADAIRAACGLDEADIPPSPTADIDERARVENRLAEALSGELSAAQVARVTGAVAAVLQR
ncbi:hypothetical protein [Methylobacterium sp. sgz302541]|uniref:hypothetical protein n=1 Tax=unclassified Methylobacterium TaxID=2615210 RepID=UPI003D32A447